MKQEIVKRYRKSFTFKVLSTQASLVPFVQSQKQHYARKNNALTENV